MPSKLPNNLNKFSLTEEVSYPEKICIESTRWCNLGCPHCRRTVFGYDSTEPVAPAVLRQIERLVPHLEIASVTGWGESLMGESVWDILGFARESKVSSSVTTNGSLLTEARCRRLIEMGVGTICVSFDAGTAEGFARVRPGGVPFERIVEGVQRLIRMRDAAGSATPIVVGAFNFYEASVEEIIPFIRLMGELGIRRAILQPLFLPDFPEDSHHYRLPQTAESRYDDAAALACESGIELSPDLPEVLEFHLGRRTASPDDLIYYPAREEVREHHLVPTCLTPWRNPFLDIYGNLYPCNIYPESFGNVAESSFDEVWRNEKFREFRTNLVTGNPSEACLRCRQTLWYRNDLSAQMPSIVRMDTDGLVGMGWNDLEMTHNGVPFRWSRDTFSIHLGNSGERFLYLEAKALVCGHQVELTINGKPVGPIQLPNHWAIIYLSIPADETGTLNIGFRCNSPKRDPAFKSDRERRRILGLAVAQIGLCGTPGEIVALHEGPLDLIDGMAPDSSNTQVAILSPTGDLEWEIYSDQIIRWKCNPKVVGTSVVFRLYDSYALLAELGGFDDPSGEGTARISVPPLRPGTRCTLRAESVYKLENPELFPPSAVESQDIGVTILNEVKTQLPDPEIAIVSPADEQEWEMFTAHSVAWKCDPDLVGTVVVIRLYDGSEVLAELGQFSNPTGDGMARISVPRILPGTRCRLRVESAYRLQNPDLFATSATGAEGVEIRIIRRRFTTWLNHKSDGLKRRARKLMGIA